jgi:biopolymer transport protein ExbB/TolQ
MNVEEVVFEVTELLRVPVLVLALATLLAVVADVGVLAGERLRRRGRALRRLDEAIHAAEVALATGDRLAAGHDLRRVAHDRAMADALQGVVDAHGRPAPYDRVAKLLAEFDLRSLRRLERTRVLVRMGPALGLMGTLIPLSPALSGLAGGDVAELTENLRVAFGVTVVGLLVGALAFGISLIRDRLYAQDHSDLEYVAARLAAVPVARPHAVAA